MLESYYAAERREQKRFGEFIRTTTALLNTIGEFDLLLSIEAHSTAVKPRSRFT